MEMNNMESKLEYFLTMETFSISSRFREMEIKYIRKIGISLLKYSVVH